MYREYKLNHKIIAYILLLILYLQGCNNFYSPIATGAQEKHGHISKSSNRINIQTHLLDKEFTSSEGDLVRFYEQEGLLKAEVKVDASQPSVKRTTRLGVTIAPDVKLGELARFPSEMQKRFIHVQRVRSVQEGRVLIFRAGLPGGMMEGTADPKIEGQEKEANSQNDLSNCEQLTNLALQGDAESQFRLGKRAYETWQEQSRTELNREAREWLGKAAIQGHQEAIALLKEMNLVLIAKHELKEEERDLAELSPNSREEKRKEAIYLPPTIFQTLWQISQTTGGETYRDKSLEILAKEIQTKEDIKLTCGYFKKLASLGTVDKLITQFSKALPAAYQGKELADVEAYLNNLYNSALGQTEKIPDNSGEREFTKLKLTYNYYCLLAPSSSTKERLFKELENTLDKLDLITNLKMHLAARKKYIRYLLEEASELDLSKDEHIKQYIQEVEEIAHTAKSEAKNNPQEAKELRSLAGKLYYSLGNLSKRLIASSGREKSEDYQLSYYGRAKKLGNKAACYHLGELYEGQLTNRTNLRKAKEHYVEAAKQGNVLAEYKLALLNELEEKQELALEWYKRAAIQGHPEALYKLYQFSKQQVKDIKYKENLEYLQQASDLGHKEAQYELGKYYWDKGEYTQAIHCYHQAAYRGIQTSYIYLGLAARKGLGQAKDSQAALDFYLRAEKGGEDSAIAKYGRARLYEKGEGVPINFQTALSLYSEASTLGNAKACYHAGRLHLQGNIPGSDIRKGYELVELAGKAGIAKACLLLAMMYEHGLGIVPDTRAALGWYTRASIAEKKNVKVTTSYTRASALYHAGWLYRRGKDIIKNEKEGLLLLEQASIAGKDNYTQARDEKESLKKLLIEKEESYKKLREEQEINQSELLRTQNINEALSKELIEKEQVYKKLKVEYENSNTAIIASLLEKESNINNASQVSTLLHFAAQNGCIDVLTTLLSKSRANIHATNQDGKTALHEAALNGHAKVVALLLDKGANIHNTDRNGRTPLHFAAQNGHTETLILLLNKGANIHIVDQEGRTAIHIAAINGHVSTVAQLIEKGAQIDALDRGGFTPLHLATRENRMDVVAFLLDKNANMLLTNHTVPLHIAVENGYTELSKLLLDKDSENLTIVSDTGRRSDKHKMIDHVDRSGRTALHLASAYGYTSIVGL